MNDKVEPAPVAFEIESGNHVFRAKPRGNFGWDVEIVTPGPFASGLSRDDAALCLRRLKAAHLTTKPAVRIQCPECREMVSITKQDRFTTHGSDSGNGTWVRCRMSAKTP